MATKNKNNKGGTIPKSENQKAYDKEALFGGHTKPNLQVITHFLSKLNDAFELFRESFDDESFGNGKFELRKSILNSYLSFIPQLLEANFPFLSTAEKNKASKTARMTLDRFNSYQFSKHNFTGRRGTFDYCFAGFGEVLTKFANDNHSRGAIATNRKRRGAAEARRELIKTHLDLNPKPSLTIKSAKSNKDIEVTLEQYLKEKLKISEGLKTISDDLKFLGMQTLKKKLEKR